MFNGMYGIGQQSELPQSGQFGYGMENQAGHQPTYSEQDPYSAASYYQAAAAAQYRSLGWEGKSLILRFISLKK